MKTRPLMTIAAASSLALMLGLAGCDQADQAEEEQAATLPEQTSTAEAPASPPAGETELTDEAEANRALESAREKAREAAASLKSAGEEVGAAATAAAGEALEAVKARADETAASLKAASAQATAAAAAAAATASEKTRELAAAMAEKSGEMSESASGKAKEMMAQVKQYLEENDLDSARGVMDRLDALKDQLSEETQKQIDELKLAMDEQTGSEPSR